MTIFAFHIGGKVVKTVNQCPFYIGGKVVEENVDADTVSYMTLLDKCRELGFTNIKEIWFKEEEIVRSLEGGKQFGAFLSYAFEHKKVLIYIEHGAVQHSYFGEDNPKNRCAQAGIDEHGHRTLGLDEIEEGDLNEVDRGYLNEVEEGEFDGYITEPSAYEVDDEYWVDVPYLSPDEDDEHTCYRQKKLRFKRRNEKNKEKVGGLSNGSGQNVGGPRFGGSNFHVGEPSNEPNQFEQAEGEFVNEILKEMDRRSAPRQPETTAEKKGEYEEDSGSEGSYLTDSTNSDGEGQNDAEHESGSGGVKLVPYRRPRFMKGDAFPIFKVLMVFPNKLEFKIAVEAHAVYFRRNIWFKQNDKVRCRAVCCSDECGWVILCSIDGNSKDWMVKTYVDQHTCQQSTTISCLTYKTVAQWFISKMKKVTLKLSHQEMKDHFHGQTRIQISRTQCRYAKEKVVAHYHGNPDKEFARLEDYMEELKLSNLGSTVVLEEDGGMFKRMYVCFDGVRKGFNLACRKIVGLDGCFLKGPFRGEILSAVGRDPNDQIYPIAWAVVSYECKETWRWFLELLMHDLEIAGQDCVYGNDGLPIRALGQGFTFISDQQKGLLIAMKELMPAAVYRRCARHIFAKWRKEHNSEILHQQFWKVCKSYTHKDFFDELEEMKGMSERAVVDFLEIPSMYWCRAFQEPSDACCEVVDNNMSETFKYEYLHQNDTNK